ncbi:MAG: response regulator [Desulfobacterales bacterium]|nr:response regulator [Desulfobacterales bacterium]
MYKILLIGMENVRFTKIVKALKENSSVELDRTDSGGDALAGLKDKPADLVVSDEQLPDMSGLAFAEKLVVQNPMVNCVLVSSLNEADFHEASEGLGILAQLGPEPDADAAASLVEKLGIVTGRSA